MVTLVALSVYLDITTQSTPSCTEGFSTYSQDFLRALPQSDIQAIWGYFCPSVAASRRTTRNFASEYCASSGPIGYGLASKIAWRSEYKVRERIHRGIADPRLLAIPTSWGRVADPNLNWGAFWCDWLRLSAWQRIVSAIVPRV